MWHLQYRFGMNATISKNFFFNGNILDAQSRARKHCEIMNYKYIDVYPMVADIEEQEFFKLNGMTRAERQVQLASKTVATTEKVSA